MDIRQVMTKDVKVIQPETSIREAATLMKDAGIGSLLVCTNNRLVGIVTDRDLMKRSISSGPSASTGKDPFQAPIRDVMTSPLHFCFEDQDLDAARRLMERKHIRRLPVISRSKKLVGILSLDDFNEFKSFKKESPNTLIAATFILALGASVGSLLMFLFDPKQGRRRRALMRDQGVHYNKTIRHLSRQKAHHFSNKARGMIAEAKSSFYWAPEEDTWTH